MTKYRYFMSGMFSPTDGEEYEINIPSPFEHNLKNQAMKDGRFGYRFVWDEILKEPVVVVFSDEKFKMSKKNGIPYLKQWVEGPEITRYSFEEFKKAGGYMRMLKPECKGLGFIDENTDFVDTNKTFSDVFPNMDKQKLYYINNEAYCLEEMER